jgi:transcriptional regulator with XRE-family HTH domain
MDKELEEWHRLHKYHFYSGSYETKELAEYLGVSSRTIQRWVKEKTKPHKKQLLRISKYLSENESKPTL